jgi:hypothetical protein
MSNRIAAPAVLSPFATQSGGGVPKVTLFAQLLAEGKISDQTFEEWNREQCTLEEEGQKENY